MIFSLLLNDYHYFERPSYVPCFPILPTLYQVKNSNVILASDGPSIFVNHNVAEMMILGGVFLNSSKVVFLLKPSTERRLLFSVLKSNFKALIRVVFPALLWPIITFAPS